MRKVNFDTLDRLTVPPELMEKALAIPRLDRQPPAEYPYRRTRLIASAASVVLVVLAGIAVYVLFGNKGVPVMPSAPATATVTEKVSNATEPENGTVLEPTMPVETGTPGASALPVTEHVTEGGTADPVTPATVSPTASPPSEASSEPPTEAVTNPPSPTEPPTQRVTEPPATEPETDPFEPEPSLPYDGDPMDPVPGEPGSRYVYSDVDTDSLTGSGRIYCVLYDRAGNRVDAESILSESHLAVITQVYGSSVFFAYAPPEEWGLPSAMYDMEVYNEDGGLIQTTIVFLS